MCKRTILPLAAWFLTTLAIGQNDIENVVVETYYVSNANDATDTIGGGLVAGSRTYRVFLDLCDSCALRSIYGDVNHVLEIASTALFFNNRDRGETYGHVIPNNRLDENTVALDSWLAMGAASNQKFGVLKSEDPDGTILDANDGGSAQNGPLLVNADPDAGIPLTQQDGLVPLGGGSALPPGFNATGTTPDSIFSDSIAGAVFSSNDTRISCTTPGVKGPTVENKILIAQLTTAGELSFCLNIEVERADGTIIKYVPGLGFDDEQRIVEWQLYPNPASAVLTIRAQGLSGQAKLVVLDALGRSVLESTVTPNGGEGRTDLAIDRLARGPYLLRMETEGAVWLRTFIAQ
ncbi:MAG: T9SS type A sorting domain-containing protein [Flavobacteriales bacterium]|nr:T9SS type A sorting domain-containing protein [Flavobacteriales bacterium]